MTDPRNPLHDMLADLAHDVEPVDLYQPVIRRSRQIGRRRATAAAGVSLALIGVLGGGLWKLTMPAPAPAPPAASSVAGLPGTLFYSDGSAVIRLAKGVGPQTVIPAESQSDAEVQGDVSPDGRRVAVLTAKAEIVVSEGGQQRTVLTGAASGQYGPSWSADGGTLLTAKQGPDGKPQPGLLTIADGTFTTLPVPPTATDVLLSGDRRSVVYSDNSCRVTVAPVAGGAGAVVPVLGDTDRSINPAGRSVCDIYDVSADASQVAVRLQVTGTSTDEIGADTIVDTATGQVVTPPDDGGISAALFGPNASTLYRCELDGTNLLVVLDSDGRIIARVKEPAAVRDMALLAYTR